jgi:ribosomal protein S3AE
LLCARTQTQSRQAVRSSVKIEKVCGEEGLSVDTKQQMLKAIEESTDDAILGNYRLIYRLRSADVQIVTVHHGARQLNPAELESGA